MRQYFTELFVCKRYSAVKRIRKKVPTAYITVGQCVSADLKLARLPILIQLTGHVVDTTGHNVATKLYTNMG